MAAYAALVSLLNTMDHFQIHPLLSTSFDNESLGFLIRPLFLTSFDKEQIQSLGETVGFLLDFIESYNGGGRTKQVQDLEAKIASAARAAEDAIESHIVDLIHAGSTNENGGLLQKMMTSMRKNFHLRDLRKVTKHMDLIKKEVAKVDKQGRSKHQTTDAASSRPISAGKTTIMVGFDDYLIHLLDRLTGPPSHQVVIPIIGMGGLGKTTLARNAFDSLLIKQRFDVRAWATISQNYSVRDILLQLLPSEEDSGSFMALDEQQLGEELHKYLFNRRYLIILDDMWSIGVRDEIMCFFPCNDNGSRIVLTTRLLDIARNFKPPYLTLNLLDEDKSWNLFCQESFGKDGCPPELERVGKKICKNCKGLPLSIVVIGGFLRKSNKSCEYWEGVARDTYSILSSEWDNQCMDILSLSYNHLPAHLKPCFLYMDTFSEDEDILVSRLIQLWVAEGFLRAKDGQSLEEVGMGYLKDLVDRNLVLVNRWGSNGKEFKECIIHDLIRELCLRVAKKEKFLCDVNLTINKKRHILTSYTRVSNLTVSLIRRVLPRGVLEDELRSVNLRFLEHQFQHDSIIEFNTDFNTILTQFLHIPKNIYFLWNLQTLIIKGYVDLIAPSELWEMIQLRHLKVCYLCLQDPPARDDRVNLVLPNLQTLCTTKNLRLSEEVCKRIPNVKRLHLVYDKTPQRCEARSYYCPQNLGLFHKLESLTLTFKIYEPRIMMLKMIFPGSLTFQNQRSMVFNMTFPSSLKKLTLYVGGLYWEDLEMIGSLRNLEVLKLKRPVIGTEWNPVEGGFPSLKFLQIECFDMSIWNAEHFHFPVLEKLDLQRIPNLKEIPAGIWEIQTLRSIHLLECNVPCSLSAVKMLKEQESLGNDDLQLEIGFLNKEEHELFKEIVEQEWGFTSKNLHTSFTFLYYFNSSSFK